jgi:hypothetical protein
MVGEKKSSAHGTSSCEFTAWPMPFLFMLAVAILMFSTDAWFTPAAQEPSSLPLVGSNGLHVGYVV